jgi:hypothetical protein
MATLRQYNEGGYYIYRGYPIRLSQREEDMFHTTIQVLPRAERFFELVGWRDGQIIPREVFYAVLLDGDLSSPAIEQRAPTVDNVPKETLYIAEGLADSEQVISFLREPAVIQCRYLVDFYQTLRRLKPADTDPSLAAYVCLARHLRQATYERERR